MQSALSWYGDGMVSIEQADANHQDTNSLRGPAFASSVSSLRFTQAGQEDFSIRSSMYLKPSD